MNDLTEDDIEATLETWSSRWPFRFVGTPSAPADLERLPAAWRPIVLATDPAERRASALALWNDDLLAHLPAFSQVLRERLADVRVCLTDGIPALVYVVPGDHEPWITWIGYDPRAFGTEPPFWDVFPSELRTFLREVHAGFMSRRFERYGPTRPAWMETLAESVGEPDGFEDWDDVQDIPSTRLLIIAREGELMHYCISPDADPGEIVQVYEGDIDPRPMWPALDELLLMRLDVR